jgi:hypothetical protein
MKCDEIRIRIADLFDDTMSPGERQEWIAHFDQCNDCREVYNDCLMIADMLKPAGKATIGTAQINKIIEQTGSKWHRTLRIAASVSIFLGLAMGLIYITSLRNPILAAGPLLEKSIHAINALKSVYMVFSVRTSVNENFESIDPTAGFIDFKVWSAFGKEPRWRFEKPGRTIIMDGQSQYMIQETGGYVLKGTPNAGFVGWMKLFLDPMKILETELGYARQHPSSCAVKETGDQIELTVKVQAQGNFSNPWAMNASIPEANTRRVYSFDKETHMLSALTVFIESGQEFICVLKLTGITVNPLLADSNFIFGNRNKMPVLTLEQWDEASSRGFKDLSAEEAVRIFFTACEKNDWQTVQRFSPLFSIPGSKSLKPVISRFSGSRLLRVGQAFTSGIYGGIYVPYEIRLKSGDTLAGNIAIRKDNAYQTWNVDGGY